MPTRNHLSLIISLLTIIVITAKSIDQPSLAGTFDPLPSLISKAKSIGLGNYPAIYANQVTHALIKAEKLAGNSSVTDEQLNLARLELQVAIDLLTVDLQKATIPDLQNLIKSGKLTYKQLTQMYLHRIELFDRNTVKLNSIRTLNPQAITDAEQCDLAFATDPSVAKGKFGMPILIKDKECVKSCQSMAILLQFRIVTILDKLVNNLCEGLPTELNMHRQQHEYYRNKVLTFKEVA